MIISGGSRSNGRFFAKHLMNPDTNELVRIVEIRGLGSDNLQGCFREMEAVAMGTRCKNSFYHANINPREDEDLTEEQWKKAVDTLEQNLGLEGHTRFVVEHEKEGRTHRHVVWSRIDPDSMTAVSDSKTFAIHMKTADALETEFGHERTPRGRGPEGRRPDNWEVFRGQESGLDPNDVKAELTALWRQADTGQAFAAALEERGYILAKGDRRDFVVVDPNGDDHSLARRIGGVRAADVRARMKDVDRDALPSVEEARAMARDREDAEPTGTSPATQSTTAPVQEHGPLPLTELAQELTQGAKDAFTQKQPEPIPAELAGTEATAFDCLAQNLVREAQEAGPVAGELAVAAAVLEGEHLGKDLLQAKNSPAPDSLEPIVAGDSVLERSVFERIALERKQAWREAGGDDDSLMTAGLDWLAQKMGTQRPGRPSADREPTTFERMAEETKQAMRDNGGQPYSGGEETSFWQRARSLLISARDRAAAWVKGTWADLVGRFTRDRTTGRDDPGLER